MTRHWRTVFLAALVLLVLFAMTVCGTTERGREAAADAECSAKGAGWRFVDLAPDGDRYHLACVHVDSLIPYDQLRSAHVR